MNQYQQKGLLLLIGGVILLVSFVVSGKTEVAVFRYFGIIAVGLSTLLLLFDRLLWRWQFLYDWLVPSPDLNGVWKGSGHESVLKVGSDGKLIIEEESLETQAMKIEQSFVDIWLSITWSDGSISRLRDPVPYSVSGRKAKTLTFSGVYDYQNAPNTTKPRNVIVTASMETGVFRNRPSTVMITYFAGDQLGVINLTDRRKAQREDLH